MPSCGGGGEDFHFGKQRLLQQAEPFPVFLVQHLVRVCGIYVLLRRLGKGKIYTSQHLAAFFLKRGFSPADILYAKSVWNSLSLQKTQEKTHDIH